MNAAAQIVAVVSAAGETQVSVLVLIARIDSAPSDSQYHKRKTENQPSEQLAAQLERGAMGPARARSWSDKKAHGEYSTRKDAKIEIAKCS